MFLFKGFYLRKFIFNLKQFSILFLLFQLLNFKVNFCIKYYLNILPEEDYNKSNAALEKRMENGDINFTNLGHHTLIGLTNSVLERFSGRLGRQVYNSISGASKREVKKG